MLWDIFSKGDTPNKFTLAMGELIKQAREEMGWTQEQLAQVVYRRRPSISEMESGKMIPDSITLFLMAVNLHKPFAYFIPEFYRRQLPQEKLSLEEQELIAQFRRLGDNKQQRAVINQVRAMAETFSEDE